MAKSNVCKSTLTLVLVLLTAGISTTFAQKALTPPHVLPALADGGGGDPVPPDPGPPGPSIAAMHLT